MTRRRLKFRHFAIAIPVLLGVGTWVLCVVLARQAHAGVRVEVAKLRAMGIPTTPEEMRRPVDVTLNAAPIYRSAIATYHAGGTDRPPGVRRLRSGLPDPLDVAAYRKWIAANAPTLELVRRASKLPQCDFGRRWEDGWATVSPELHVMESFVRLAVGRFHMALDAGHLDAAFDWLSVANRVTHHMREPGRLWQTTRVDKGIQVALQQEMIGHGAEPEFRQRARLFLDGLGPLPLVRDEVAGEVVMLRTSFKLLANMSLRESRDWLGLKADDGTQWFLYAWQLDNVRDGTEAKLLRDARRSLNAIEGAGGSLRKQMHAAVSFGTPATGTSMGAKIADQFDRFLPQWMNAILTAATHRQLSKCALHLWDIRSNTGSFPKALDGSKPWTIDPGSDKPFVYRLVRGSFTLYGVGPNGADDGGYLSRSAGYTDDVEFGKISQFFEL